MWFVLALLSALFQVLRNISMKHLGHELDDIINVWGRFTFLLPFVALASAWHGMPELKAGFWPCVIGFGVTQSIATLSLSKALNCPASPSSRRCGSSACCSWWSSPT